MLESSFLDYTCPGLLLGTIYLLLASSTEYLPDAAHNRLGMGPSGWELGLRPEARKMEPNFVDLP